jgi:transaldolase
MTLFRDTAVLDEIRTVHSWGVLDGVTTNPSLFAKAGGGTYPEVLEEICGITSGAVSAEVVAKDLEGMLSEGREFAKIAPNIVVKVPMTEAGLTAMSTFAEEGIKTNCTLVFSTAQGLLAAKAGATYLSPFVGRLDDIGQDGMDMVRELSAVLEIHGMEAEIIVASTRSPRHVIEGALAGAHIATVPFKVLEQMAHHPLTDKGIAQFEADWQKAQAELAAKA